ncbi:MAG: LptF/LptG family permease [Fimbriimonas sp.]
MKQIDRLILKEIFGPWIFGVGLFAALLMAGTYLNKIADYVVQGAPGGLIIQLVALLIPAILVKTFTMAVLLAALLAFGRLSSDSEIVALRAGGASIYRIVQPVMLFSFAIALVTFGFNEIVVPSAASRAKTLMRELADKGPTTDGEPIEFPIATKGKLRAHVVAQSFNLGARLMRGVTIVAYGDDGKTTHYLSAPEMEYRGENEWRILGTGTKLIDAQGGYVLKMSEVWPESIPKITKSPADLLLASNNDPDLLSMREVQAEITRAREDGDVTDARVRNMEYWYWNKISVPLAAFIFGTLGAVLGIRNHRTGTAAGFALAVGIIFGYVTLANFMNVWAQGGVLPPWAASFAPLALGLVASGIIMWKRNA